ncbi:unnamed protein product, partial [Cuscuta epithymum]
MKGTKEVKFPKLVDGKLSQEQREEFYGKMEVVILVVDVYSSEYNEFDCEGVIISPERHVLNDMFMNNVQTRVQIVTANKERYACTVLALDPTYGLAILKIGVSNSTALAFPYAMISDRDDLRIGEEIYPIGLPGYLFNSFPIGHISYRSFGEVLKLLKNPLKK